MRLLCCTQMQSEQIDRLAMERVRTLTRTMEWLCMASDHGGGPQNQAPTKEQKSLDFSDAEDVNNSDI